MIAVLCIGLKRFESSTKKNHEKLFKILNRKFGIKIYDCYRNAPIPNCPFPKSKYEASGKVQMFDFITNIAKVSEDIVIKLRSDVFFTDTAIEVLVNELEKIINDENDLAYLGLDFHKFYDQKYKITDALNEEKITDFVIIVRKSLLPKQDYIINFLHNHFQTSYESSGNIVFFLLINTNTRATKVSTQLYLLRKDYKKTNNWQIYYDWCKEYALKSPSAIRWVENNRELINNF